MSNSIIVKEIVKNRWGIERDLEHIEIFPMNYNSFIFKNNYIYTFPEYGRSVNRIKRICTSSPYKEFQGFEKELIKYFKRQFLYYESSKYNIYINKNKILSIKIQDNWTYFTFSDNTEQEFKNIEIKYI